MKIKIRYSNAMHDDTTCIKKIQKGDWIDLRCEKEKK